MTFLKTKLNQRTRDLLIAGVVAFITFLVIQSTVIVGGWWFRDAPFPADAKSSDRVSTDLEARLIIPSINVDIPIVWSESTLEADLQKDLEKGAIHYPGTALPGSIGNAFISAHSSDFPWKQGDYKYAFAKLNSLDIGDEDISVVYFKDGVEVERYSFHVTQKEIVAAADTRMIEQKDTSEITLVTCWPLGTNWKRVMVKAERV